MLTHRHFIAYHEHHIRDMWITAESSKQLCWENSLPKNSIQNVLFIPLASTLVLCHIYSYFIFFFKCSQHSGILHVYQPTGNWKYIKMQPDVQLDRRQETEEDSGLTNQIKSTRKSPNLGFPLNWLLYYSNILPNISFTKTGHVRLFMQLCIQNKTKW